MVKNKTKMKHKYIFPDLLGRLMSKVDVRTQLEASMMSMSLMSVGLIITVVYIILYITFPLWYKIVLVVNCLAGIIFMWSFITTSFQQYRNYLEVQDFQRDNSSSKLSQLKAINKVTNFNERGLLE